MNRTSYSVACLARHGGGPEVMAAASRALEGASRLHGFFLDEHHVPFGADALMRFGHPFPLSSRRAVLEADAVLVASEAGEALEVLEDELDLRASVARVRFDERGETIEAFASIDRLRRNIDPHARRQRQHEPPASTVSSRRASASS